jgi:hypothetical protein
MGAEKCIFVRVPPPAIFLPLIFLPLSVGFERLARRPLVPKKAMPFERRGLNKPTEK